MTRVARAVRWLGLALFIVAAGAGPGAAQSDPAQSDKGALIAAPSTGSEAEARRTGASGLPLPRFVSLRAPKANLRTGPGVRYPIDWVYMRPGLPLEIIGEFETWRRVRDWDGSTGWIHQSMLSGERRALVLARQRLLRREPAAEAAGVALIEPGVTGKLRRCADTWCKVEVKGFEGWVLRDEIYGVYTAETIN